MIHTIIRSLVYITFIMLSFILTNAYAEYYLVYSQPDSRCYTCVSPKNITPRKHYSVKAKTTHHKLHYTAHKKKSACRKSIYYHEQRSVCASCVPACQTCATAVYDSHRFVDFSSQPYAYHARYFTADDYAYTKYDPDLATGDDDQMRYPDMDIDR